MKKWPLALAAVSTLSFAVASSATSFTQAFAASSQPLVQALGVNPDNLTPGMGGLAVDNGPLSLMNAPLVYLDIHDKWQGELATSWTESKDGLTYTFHLNPKAKWSDGTPLTASDLVYTWHYYTNPNLKFTYVTGWDKVKSVTAPNKTTVVFKLSSSYAPFMETVASSYVVPQHVFSKVSADKLNHGWFDTHPISSGPYIMKSWTADQQLDFVANPNWWGPKVHINEMIFKIIPDSTTAFNSLVTGDLTMGGIPPEQLGQVGQLKSNFNIIQPLDATYGQITPVERGFLKDVKVRQALDFATPKAEIVKFILKGMGIVAHGDQVPGSYYYNPSIKGRPFSLTKAAAMLKADGFTKGSDGWLQKGGKELTVPIWTGSTSTTYMSIAQAVSAEWERIGVNAPVKTADWSFIFGDKGPQFDGKAEALLFSWGQGVFPDDTIDFNSKYILQNASSPGENAGRYSNPQMDKLTVEGTTLASQKARQKVYFQIQQLEYRDVPLIFIYWVKSEIAVSKHLHGYQQTVFGTTPVWDWSLN